MKGEGEKEGNFYLNKVILSNLHMYTKIGNLL